MRFDELIKSLESFKDLLKSNYGPKGTGQYTVIDNQKRKSRNVEENVLEGPNKNTKRYTSAATGTAQQQASKEARKMRAASKKNPVKTLSSEELATFATKRGVGVSAKKNDEMTSYDKNGQWKLSKYGGAMTLGNAGVGAAAMGGVVGSANKAEKDPSIKPRFYPKIIKPENVTDVGAQGFKIELPKEKKTKGTKKPKRR